MIEAQPFSAASSCSIPGIAVWLWWRNRPL